MDKRETMGEDKIRKARAAIALVKSDECQYYDASRCLCQLSSDASAAGERAACWCWAKAEAVVLSLVS